MQRKQCELFLQLCAIAAAGISLDGAMPKCSPHFCAKFLFLASKTAKINIWNVNFSLRTRNEIYSNAQCNEVEIDKKEIDGRIFDGTVSSICMPKIANEKFRKFRNSFFRCVCVCLFMYPMLRRTQIRWFAACQCIHTAAHVT